MFEAAIRKCDAALKPRGIDIFRILTEKDPKMFEYIVHAFVGITAVQVIIYFCITSLQLFSYLIMNNKPKGVYGKIKQYSKGEKTRNVLISGKNVSNKR